MQNVLNKTEKSYILEEWQKGYDSQPDEYEYWVDNIEGTIPSELEGTIFRNGPGLLDIGGTPIHHPFDGDGMICAITFKGGKVHFRNRFVRTEGYVKEQAAGKILYRGAFGTKREGGWLANIFDLKVKNIANTNVIYWGDKLLALWEAAVPYRLDPSNLDTIGVDYLDGLLQPGDSLSAHPWIDPSCELDKGESCLVNFSIKPGSSSKINVFEFSPHGKLLRRYSHTVPGFCFIHDCVITPHYCIFFQSNVNFNPLMGILGFKGLGECVQFNYDKPTRIILIPRTPPHQEIKIFETQAGFVFHHANAFESENNEQVFIDSICYQSLPQIDPDKNYKNVDFDKLDPGQLWRFSLDLKQGDINRKMLNSRCCEFPTINPEKVGRDYQYLYIGAAHKSEGNAPLQALLKLDLYNQEQQFYSFAPHGYVGEPIFIPKPNSKQEDDGWIFMMVYDGSQHRSDVVLFEAKDINSGPIARIHLKHHIPYGLHGFWTPECFVN
jgi:all-trans-8'-apo-beta-carotenal 15,15'-oxygenase